LPTGGVSPDEANLRLWFEAGVAAVGMGSNLVRKEWLSAGRFDAITDLTRTVLDLIRSIRTAKK
jgi:2-dehydro-3-deoxyphosphogluconate aldolase/(4S)-4-hydroxy-2-oxoglutarate aldolase